MTRLTNSIKHVNPRIYLSFKHKEEYFKKKYEEGDRWYKKTPKKSRNEIFDTNTAYIGFIKNVLNKAFEKKNSYQKTQSFLRGLSRLIKFYKKEKRILYSVEEILQSDIVSLYETLATSKALKKNDVLNLDCLFGLINMSHPQIYLIKKELYAKIKPKEKNKAIPSSVIYQLEKYIQEEYKYTKNLLEEYWEWNNEFIDSNFIKASDLLKTVLKFYENNSEKYPNDYIKLLTLKLQYDYGINCDFLAYSEYEFKKFSFEKKNHISLRKRELEKIALSGENIDFKNIKYALYWLKELFPKFPFSNVISDKYGDFKKGNFKAIRAWISKYFHVDLKLLDKRIYPQNNDIYPLYLLLLIKTGANQEVIKKWQVVKNDKGSYLLDADELEMFTIVDSVKEKSNSSISVTIKNNSFEKKYLDLYVKWASPIYENSKNKLLFQYLNTSGGMSKKYQSIDHSFLINIRNSPTSFYKKYEIIDLNNNRLNTVDHTSIRKSHNYQDFLNGKLEFERQLKKTHKSGDTTKTYYENQNFEWKEAKKHKIALAQNLVVGIFRGEITREEHKSAKLFEVGPMADCKDNKHPTFDYAPNMKENEYCTDWTKCLTLCDKSFVIPKVHGPVIFAWIKYMDNRKEDFIREQDWEKEYLIDYQSAKDTIKNFTKEENDFCISERYKHLNFVQIKFSKTYKAKGEIHA